MIKILKKLFSKKRDNLSLYRVLLTNIQTEEAYDGVLDFICSFVIINHQTQEVSKLEYSFVGDVFDDRAVQFFDFLVKSKVEFVDYFELVGIVFDAEMYEDVNENKSFVYKKILACPF